MGYQIQGDQFGAVRNEEFIALGKDIRIISCSRDVDTNEFYIKVEFLVGNNVVSKEVKMDSNLINQLEDSGYLANRRNEASLKDYIDQQLKELTNEARVHKFIGWVIRNDELVFQGLEVIGSQKISRYNGSLDISCSCKLKEYVKACNELIHDNVKLEFGIAMGLSGCMASYLNMICDEIIDCPIYDIYGGSSTGKSTILDLAVSTCGNPYAKSGKESLRATCSTTKNALIARLTDNYGFFTGFDELGRLNSNDISDILYQIADGTGKGRCIASGSLKETSKWMTAVGFTGEYSVFDIADKKDGLLNRVFSFDNVTWTKNGEESKSIKEFAAKYYGVPVHKLAIYLQSADKQSIIEDYKSTVSRLEPLVPVPQEFKERTATRVAIVILTAKYASTAIKINLRCDCIERFLLYSGLSHFKPESEKAYAYFLSRFSQETAKFSNSQPETKLYRSRNKEQEQDGSFPFINGRTGYINWNSHINENGALEYNIHSIVIRAVDFNNWMKDGGFKNLNYVLKTWREKSILISEPDRFVVKRVLVNGGAHEKAYQIKYTELDDIPNVFTALLINIFKVYLESSKLGKTENEYCKKLIDSLSKGSIGADFYDSLREQYLNSKLDCKKAIVKFYHIDGPKIIKDSEGKEHRTCYIKNLTKVDEILQFEEDRFSQLIEEGIFPFTN